MSHFFTGIIGVIIFVALSLAGALFLGPRFQRSDIESKAATVTQAISQIVAAASLQKMETGQNMTVASAGDFGILLSNGYLKDSPINPVEPTRSFRVLNPANIPIVVGEPAGAVFTSVGLDRSVCDAINRQTGGPTTPAATTANTDLTPFMTRSIGCFRLTGAGPSPAALGAVNAHYIAYAKF